MIVQFLEMHENPNLEEIEAPLENVDIVKWKNPKVAEYRKLYNKVGVKWHWIERNFQTDDEIIKIITDPEVFIFCLKVNNEIVGFAELNFQKPPDLELKYFGLKQQWIGQGLGKYFLYWLVRKVWTMDILRFWLHTASNDYPGAMFLYQKAKFKIYKTEIIN